MGETKLGNSGIPDQTRHGSSIMVRMASRRRPRALDLLGPVILTLVLPARQVG
jgi:hypothetical protein